jgi:hypothetical protein
MQLWTEICKGPRILIFLLSDMDYHKRIAFSRTRAGTAVEYSELGDLSWTGRANRELTVKSKFCKCFMMKSSAPTKEQRLIWNNPMIWVSDGQVTSYPKVNLTVRMKQILLKIFTFRSLSPYLVSKTLGLGVPVCIDVFMHCQRYPW